MTMFEREVTKAEEMGLTVIEGYRFDSGIKGMIVGTYIFLSRDLETDGERVAVLLEEVSHYRTNCGNILNQSVPDNRRQERKAHIRMVKENLPIERIVGAALTLGEGGHMCELADELGVSESFLIESIGVWRDALGPTAVVCGHVVCFDPFRLKEEA